ncbi:fmt [Symbiodinium necroappetens]|uniref:Fmt protein n=1 Tax=Symbiodinium necroappetens TaxID=1628268 RepID=A0A812Q5H7_9DINO|nr:fmt [Symbiodinium necroappetens]
MFEAPGIGLAAPQVGLPWRMFVCHVGKDPDDEHTEDPPDYSTEPMVVINPTLSEPSRDLVPYEEGCLSLPEITGDVRRPSEVTLTALDASGEEYSMRASGLLARCWQHEYDHLDGILIIDKMTAGARLKNRRAIKELPDKPAGRKRVLTPTPIAQHALGEMPDTPLLRPPNINEPAALAEARSFECDAWVVIAYGQKLSSELLADRFAINLHASLLPRWRGAAPINHAIIAGDNVTGNSVIALAERMDAGVVYGQSERPIEPTQTAGELHDALAGDGPSLVMRVLAQHADGSLTPEVQDESRVTIASKLAKADGWIRPEDGAAACRGRINGLSPWPGVSVEIAGEPMKILCAKSVDGGPEQTVGTLAEFRGELGIACAGGTALVPLRVQAPGKKEIEWDAYVRGKPSPKAKPRPRPKPKARPRAKPPTRREGPMAQKYDAMIRECLAEHRVRVRKWRSNMSGIAWEVHYKDGTVTRLIESPRPRGPMSAAVFLHEIGHHAIGFTRYSPRCLEEYKAWEWALAEMERRELNLTDRVRQRMLDSIRYAVRKSHRRRSGRTRDGNRIASMKGVAFAREVPYYLNAQQVNRGGKLSLPTEQIQQASDQFVKRVQDKLAGASEGLRPTYTVNSRFAQLKTKLASAARAEASATQNEAIATKQKSGDAARAEAKAAQQVAPAAQPEPAAATTNASYIGEQEPVPTSGPEVQAGTERVYNFQDLEAARDLIGTAAEDSSFVEDYDLDGDGVISFSDIVQMLFNYDSGETTAKPVDAAPMVRRPVTESLMVGRAGMLVLALSCAASAGEGEPVISFAEPLALSIVGVSPDLAFEEFDVEAGYDLVSIRQPTGQVALHPNLFDGTFGPPVLFNAMASPSNLHTAELTGDTRLDLVVSSRTSNRVAVMRYSFPGVFTVVSRPLVSGAVSDIATGDLDGDGDLDLITTHHVNNTLTIAFNDGTGQFGENVTLATGTQPSGVNASDVNGDGLLDLCVSNAFSNTVSVFTNSGNRAFSPPTTLGTGSRPSDVAAGEFTGDGLTDIMMLNQSNGSVRVFPGLGGGDFGPPITYAAGSQPFDIAVVDIDQDGDDDAVVALARQDEFLIYQQVQGAFEVHTFPIAGGQLAVRVGDQDEDGMPDLAFTIDGNNRIFVYRNTTPPPPPVAVIPCPADCDGNRLVDFNDLICTLFSFGLSGVESVGSDCDGNGLVNFNDLLCVLFSFGPCDESRTPNGPNSDQRGDPNG